MSAQPDDARAPAVEAQLLARISTGRGLNRGAPAFEREGAQAPEDSLHGYEFGPRCTPWLRQGGFLGAPAVTAFGAVW